MGGRVWDDEEVEFLKKNHEVMTINELAASLGRSKKAVKHAKSRYGLTVTIDYEALKEQPFGRWRVIGEREIVDVGYGQLYGFPCQCQCERKTERVVPVTFLVRGVSRSCGCLAKDVFQDIITKHGMAGKRPHRIWKGMKARCLNPNEPAYKHYGGRGIQVAEEWMEFEGFYEWAKINGYRDDLTLDRIDVNGHYEPSNCRFTTTKVQARNRRDTKTHVAWGEEKTLAEWMEDERCIAQKLLTVSDRIRRLGWSLERALTTPIRTRKGKKKNHPLRQAWRSMKHRCHNPKCYSYDWYGAVGIKVCDDWLNDFDVFREWAMSHGWRPGLSLDRIDNKKGYAPTNCRWVTMGAQANNRSTNLYITAFGETKTVAQWSRDKRVSVSQSTLNRRIRDGWDGEEAITLPLWSKSSKRLAA